jgi:hypothetical protein
VTAPGLQIDYTNLGYDSLRSAMLDLARQSLPEWTDLSENDLGVLLVELFAYASDITLYYQSRIANNLLPETADEPDALLQLLRLIGYELRPPSPASVDLELAFDAAVAVPIEIPAGSAFDVDLPTGDKVVFETARDIRIPLNQLDPPDALNLRRYRPVPVVQGQTIVNEAVARSDGSPNQTYTLQQQPVIDGSIVVTVTEPGGTRVWQQVDNLADSTPADRVFVVYRDVNGAARILFGDNVNGMPPPAGPAVTIFATYRVIVGPISNLAADTQFNPPGLLPNNVNIVEAVNRVAAAGGAPGEDIQRARLFAPRLFRTQDRAVTAQDYADLALVAPGVGKVRAVAINSNLLLLYIAPSARVAEPSELLKQNLLAYFESRRMVTAALKIVGPRPADIYLSATVQAQPIYLRSDVAAAAAQAVADYLAFDAVDFGQPIYLSKVYDVIQSLPQVVSLNVTEFSRQPDGTVDGTGVIKLLPNELPRPGYRDNPPAGFDPQPIKLSITGGVPQ